MPPKGWMTRQLQVRIPRALSASRDLTGSGHEIVWQTTDMERTTEMDTTVHHRFESKVVLHS
ncbi:hypothetical protein C5E41_06430 [Nocardia nova]|nr:hypothetical protein C5E41_06430 [Nocardia nova]